MKIPSIKTKSFSLSNLSGRLKSGLLFWLITLFVVIIYVQDIPPLQSLEYKIEDSIRSSKEVVADRSKIAIVAIDQRSIDKVGQWPWDHERISDLLITICDYQPKAVMLDFPLLEKAEEIVAGNTEQLAETMSLCGKIILPFDIVVAEEGRSLREVPDYFHFSALWPPLNASTGGLPKVVAAFMPPEILAKRVNAVGFRYFEPDADEKVRSANLLVDFEGKVFVSAAVQMANSYLGYGPDQIQYNSDGQVICGGRILPVDNNGRMLVEVPKEGSVYATYSAIDILTGDADPAGLQGRAIVVASTTQGSFQFVPTAVGGDIPSYRYAAATAQTLINDTAPRRLGLPIPADLLLVIAIGIFGGLVLPRMGKMYRLIALFIVGFILANINYVLFSSTNILLNVFYPLVTVVLCFGASLALRGVEKTSGSGSLASSLDLEKLLDGEPIATSRDDGEELDFSDIPMRVLEDDKPSPEVFAETIRLDFEALQQGGDLIPASEYAKHDTSKKIAQQQQADSTQMQGVRQDVAESEQNETSTFIPDLLDVDMSGIQPPDADSGEMKESPRKQRKITAEPQFDATPKPGSVDEELILTEEEKKIYGVKFTNEGQPISFGRYQIIEPLGKGAMGTVYKGNDPAIDRLVALKTIRLDSIADPTEITELKERLAREAKAAGNLSHPNIVTIYDYGLSGNLQYIAMEFIEGYTLEAVLRRNLQLNYRILASIVMQVCSALEYAHSMGIIHRDIKPANIMVMDGFRVKVMDFGIAHFESSSMTQTGVAMGTPNYISPEQLQGKEVTPSSDIFSLGVVLYELLTHQRPFRGENISALVYKILNEEPLTPSTVDPKIPPLFDLILRKALAKDPMERYRTAKEFASALEDFTVSFSRKKALV